MGNRKINLASGEIYHIFNRGVDKRIIFSDKKDLERFFKCMAVFNSVEPVGSLHENSFLKEFQNKPLVEFISFNLLENHFHFILKQITENGISEFMKRLQGGYSWYFNKKYKRSGALFQGAFKSVHVDNNEYLLHLSVYVNLNDKITLGGGTAKSAKFLGKSSWDEFIHKNQNDFCKAKNIILEQFKSIKDYETFAISTLEDIRINKEKYKELEE